MATRKPHVRAVKPGEKVTARPKTVAQAAESGDHYDLLVAMRERIAKTVSDPGCPPRDLAALTRRLQDIAKEIDQIDQRRKQEADEDGGSASDGDATGWDTEAI